ncbi:deoxyribonuclease gamma [Anolis carolinensis]|uniref:Deoxyribonuclease n=1 Tax=Anolis carolinensis TaxID=28377 RepID=G1KA37_ANOCA|nr:PREDICTED: deoxyribonuclease gamma [Anolis carolinensis]|eukprot:XP_003217767.1 PREDICTED: deoxyribonuclease gamma [Anolis carolinensis]
MLCISLFLLFAFHAALSLRICSFNVRSFGEAKRTRPEIMNVIVKIISRCDIMLLMEIKDNRNRICPFLLEKLNGHSQKQYRYVASGRLGRKSYKEQYAFFYRPEIVSVKQTYQYPDLQPGNEDALSREPFVVWFSSSNTVAREFVIIPLHTTPEMAVQEIDELYDVYQDIKQHWKSENFIFMGDFNAGCGYVARRHWKDIRLRNHNEFIWLIDDQTDTTVKASTHCPYDRIVLHGDKLINAAVPNSANIFDFQGVFAMTEAQALAVSDHFPVEFQLKTTRSSPRRRARNSRHHRNNRYRNAQHVQ